MKVPLFRPPKLQGKYVGRVLASGWTAPGPVCEEFRAKVAEHFRVEPQKVVLGSSATALWQAVLWMVDPDWVYLPRVLFPPWGEMFQARGMAAPASLLSGMELKLIVDIGQVSSSGPKKKESAKCGVVLDVAHTWDVARRYYSVALMSCYRNKVVAGAGGGVALCRTREFADALYQTVNSGFDNGLTKDGGTRDWDTREIGWPAYMSDWQATLNMEAFEGMLTYREQLAASYERLRERSELTRRALPKARTPVLAQVPVRDVPRARRILTFLGISSGWHFPPLKKVTVPLLPTWTKEEFELVVQGIEEVAFR